MFRYWVAVCVDILGDTYEIHFGSDQPAKLECQWEITYHKTYEEAVAKVNQCITNYDNRGYAGLGVIDHGPTTDQSAF